METSDSKKTLHLGMVKGELDNAWFAKYWNPQMKDLPTHIEKALIAGPQSSQRLPIIEDAPLLALPGYQAFENGFGVTEDGTAVVAALTQMPNVTPAMWDWWFSWHGSDSRRYKLWNPDAHLYANWKDGLTENPGNSDKEGYLNRTSILVEYVGSAKLSLAITFVPPAEFGFDENMLLDSQQATVICGRVGLSEVQVDSGYLIHYIRQTENGSEMRSRFWLGGKYISSSNNKKTVLATPYGNDPTLIWQAYNLLVHCAKEMNHLAAFLPDIYQDYKNSRDQYFFHPIHRLL